MKISTDHSAVKAVLWKTTSDTKDFRRSVWTSTAMRASAGKENNNNPSAFKDFEGSVQTTGKGYTIIFGEVEFRDGNSKFLLTTKTFSGEGR